MAFVNTQGSVGDRSVTRSLVVARSRDEGLPCWCLGQGPAEKAPEWCWSSKGQARPSLPLATRLGTAGLEPRLPVTAPAPWAQVSASPERVPCPLRSPDHGASLCSYGSPEFCLVTMAHPAPRPWGPRWPCPGPAGPGLGRGAGTGCALTVPSAKHAQSRGQSRGEPATEPVSTTLHTGPQEHVAVQGPPP